MRCPIGLIINTLIAAAILLVAMPGNEAGDEQENEPKSSNPKERPFIRASEVRPAGE